MPTPDDLACVRRFRAGVFDGDDMVVSAVLAHDVVWGIGGRSRFAGWHEGREEVALLFASFWDLTKGTFRPWAPDSHDILEGDAHVTVLDRYVASRLERALDSSEAWVLQVEDGLINAGFHYLHDQEAFDAFWW